MKIKLIILAIIIVLLIGVAWSTVHLSLQFLPSDVVITEAKVDEYGLMFLVTENHELYIGGLHTDALGLYDFGKGRWGFLFDWRTLFHSKKDGAPIKFRSDVTDVFPGDSGFTWLGEDGMLYQFTGDTEGKPIADHVTKACSIGCDILYQTREHKAYLLLEETDETILVTEDAEDIYLATTGTIRILKQDGTVCSTNMDWLDRFNSSRIPAYSPGMPVDNTVSVTTYLSPDHTLYRHRWLVDKDETWQMIGTNIAANAVHFGFLDFYLTEEGSLVRYRSDSEDVSASEKYICHMDTKGLTKLEVCDYYVVALYADGHYECVWLDAAAHSDFLQ